MLQETPILQRVPRIGDLPENGEAIALVQPNKIAPGYPNKPEYRRYLRKGGKLLSHSLFESHESESYYYKEELDARLEIETFYNGTIRESFNALATSDGSVITVSVTSADGKNLTLRFSDGLFPFISGTNISTTGYLTVGTDEVPQGNWIYIDQADKALKANATGWPSTEHIKVAFMAFPSATQVESDGAYVNQNINEHLVDSEDQGHLSHMAERARSGGANYFSGLGPNGTDQAPATSYLDYVGASESYFKMSSGIVYQMHSHPIAAIDTSVSGEDVHVVNWNGAAYRETSNLADIVADSAGGSLSNKFFNLFFFAVGNKSGEYAPMMCQLPDGSYSTQTSAENDVDGYDNLSMPRIFSIDSSTGVPICRMTLRWSGGTTTLTHISTTDLRGVALIAGAGGGSGGGGTEIADNQFKVFDEGDITKILAFDVGTMVTSGATVTIKIPNPGAATETLEMVIAGGAYHDGFSDYIGDEHVAHSGVDIIAGAGLTGGGTITESRTINIGAGTGIDVAADAISVDVSDFMTNGADNRVVTATGTDAMNAEANLTFDGSVLGVTGNVNISGDYLLANGNYVGISANERLEFYTAGYAAFMGCDVGIGTVTPIATVPTDWNVNALSKALNVSSGHSTTDAGLFLRRVDDVTGMDMWIDGSTGSNYIDSRFNSAAAKLIYRMRTVGTPVTAMTVLGSGFVGWGIDPPVQKMHLYDGVDSSVNVAMLIERSATLSGAELMLKRDTDTRDAAISFYHDTTRQWRAGMIRHGGATIPAFTISSSADTAVTAPEFAITTTGVGIGTVAPDTPLTLGAQGSSSAQKIFAATSGNPITIYEDTDNSILYNFAVTGSDNAQFIMYADAASAKIQLHTAGNSYFLGGNVGIGTNAPDQTLCLGNEGTMGDVEYSSGWGGTDWALTYDGSGFSIFEVDNLWIRGSLRAYELIINQIGSVNGGMVISAAHGTVDTIEVSTPLSERVTMADPTNNNLASFVVGDLIRIQRVDLDNTTVVKSMYRRVSIVSGKTITFATAGVADAGAVMAVGDVAVVIGSNTQPSRDSLIYLTAQDTNNPYIQGMDGVERVSDWTDPAKVVFVMGNMNGKYNYASEIYGFAAGDISEQYITVDPTNGVRIIDGSESDNVLLQANADTLQVGSNFVYTSSTSTLQVAGWTVDPSALTAVDTNSLIDLVLGDLWTQDPSGSGGQEAVVIDGGENAVLVYDSGGAEVIRLDNNVVSSTAGLKMTGDGLGIHLTGAVGGRFSTMRPGFLSVADTSGQIVVFESDDVAVNETAVRINAAGTTNLPTGSSVALGAGIGGSTRTLNIGVFGLTNITTASSSNYGVYGEATGTNTGTNYGVYGEASNATGANWAGYFSGNVNVTGNLLVNSNYAMEGYSTGRNVLRAIKLRLQPGATPGTNINITDLSSATQGFNAPAIVDATNLAAGGSGGSFSLDAAGDTILMNVTEDAIGVVSAVFVVHNINSSSTTEMYVPNFSVLSTNLVIETVKRGTSVVVDWRTILDAGDLIDIVICFITSS